MADIVKQLLKMTEPHKPPKAPMPFSNEELDEIKAALDK